MTEEIYNHEVIEKKWQEVWRKNQIFDVTNLNTKSKYYVLEMFPYPSGTIHMGHVRNYSMGDVIARYKACRGFNVLHPMGWDAFGLPAENAAIKHHTHPAKWTYSNIAYMKKQLERLGCLFDWRREVTTCSPDYYKWEQLFFIRMFEKGLVYQKLSIVNWCLSCNTVLANEQVEEGRCWRCENVVTTKELTQWFFKITAYAQELLDGLDQLTGWPERVCIMQKNWIGKSEGAEVLFEVVDGLLKGTKLSIFTTRVDTIAGVTFLSLAPEHPLTLELAKGTPHEESVKTFVEKIRRTNKIARTDVKATKEGLPLGVHVLNPVTGAKVPVYTANFVLMDYGSGAVMAVPAHDTRDHEFAKKFQLPIVQVIEPLDGSTIDVQNQAYTAYGHLVNSQVFNGLTSEKAMTEIPLWLGSRALGRKSVSYKLRDWGVSRQRYWGSPIPIIHCKDCGAVPLPKDQLPVVLPEDVELTGEGASPLAKNEKFIHVTCPRCAKPARRETDTMDTFVESSWYYLRFCSTNRHDQPFDIKDLKYWLPIDQYIGGIEHATMHLLYFRFYHRMLQDLGYIPKDLACEPARHLLNQGIVYKDGAKMSKSKGNVVDPDSFFSKYGADTARLFVLFAAPAEKVLEWSDHGVEGCYRFLGRVWRLVHANLSLIKDIKPFHELHSSLVDVEAKKLRSKVHQTISKVSSDLEVFHFNTAIAAIMELVNEIQAFQVQLHSEVSRKVLREAIEATIRLLSPFAPHICEELWQRLDFTSLSSLQPWLSFDPDAVAQDIITIVVQVNGKRRGELTVPKGINDEQIKEAATKDTRIQTYLTGKNITRTIVVSGKLINFVVLE